MQFITKIRGYIVRHVWEADLSNLPHWHAYLVGAMRISFLVLRDTFFDGQLTLRAMSLVYTTLLSIVPLIAVAISVLKGFGVHEQVEPVLFSFLQPLGDEGEKIANNIMGFVNKIDSGLLGTLGLALLIYIVISMMHKIEYAFNYTWHVGEQRSFAKRFSDYLSVIIFGPVLIFTAMMIIASVTDSALYQKLLVMPVLGWLIGMFNFLVPYLLIVVAFTLVYIFMPNTRVRLKSAIVGAVAAGALWQAASVLFATFISNANYTAIYSAFATLFFFMIWLYLGWSILLIGASIAFYVQNPEYRSREHRALMLSNRMKEKLALMIMANVARHLYRMTSAWTLQGMARQFNIATESLTPIIDALIQAGLLVRADADEPYYMPALAPENISMEMIFAAIREAGEDDIINLRRLPSDKDVDAFYVQSHSKISDILHKTSLKALVSGDDTDLELGSFSNRSE
jgi:membrane protein